MRNKIKQLLNKEEGFTLIELLAVLAILALIVAISIPLIGNVVGDATAKTEKAQEELIIDAAQLYWVENEPKVTSSVEIVDLVTNGFLNGADFKEDTREVTITITDKSKTYEVTDVK